MHCSLAKHRNQWHWGSVSVNNIDSEDSIDDLYRIDSIDSINRIEDRIDMLQSLNWPSLKERTIEEDTYVQFCF